MKFITVKSKQTTVSVDLVPPLVLGGKQRISLVDIRIPEQYFEFTNGQAIGTDISDDDDDKLKIIFFSKYHGKYNARRLKQVLNGDSLKAELESRNNNNRQGCLSDNTINGSYCLIPPRIKTL